MIRIAVLLFIVSCSHVVQAYQLAPFGFPLGRTISAAKLKIGACTVVRKGAGWRASLSCDSAPRPASGWTQYRGDVIDNRLRRLIAYFRFANDGDGTKVTNKFKETKDLLSHRYGRPDRTFDFLTHKSIWSERRYYAMSLLKEDRTLSAYWHVGRHYIVSVEAGATSSDETHIVVAYEDQRLTDVVTLREKKQAEKAF